MIQESTITTRAIFHQDVHRLLLEKVWNKDLPKVAICMSNAGFMPSIYHSDYTTMFCINSLSALGYGSCGIVNLFSKMTSKLDLTGDLSALTCPENLQQIAEVAETCDVFIWAVGSVAENYRKVRPFQDGVFKLLEPHKDKLRVIEDSSGKQGLHPLSPSLRNKPWTLADFTIPKPQAEAETSPANSDTGNSTDTPAKPKRGNR